MLMSPARLFRSPDQGWSGSVGQWMGRICGRSAMNLHNDALRQHLDPHQSSGHDYLQSQIGNPEGDDKPNKKIYDPRVWLREGEKTFKARLKKAFEDLNNVDTL